MARRPARPRTLFTTPASFPCARRLISPATSRLKYQAECGNTRLPGRRGDLVAKRRTVNRRRTAKGAPERTGMPNAPGGIGGVAWGACGAGACFSLTRARTDQPRFGTAQPRPLATSRRSDSSASGRERPFLSNRAIGPQETRFAVSPEERLVDGLCHVRGGLIVSWLNRSCVLLVKAPMPSTTSCA